MILYRMILQSMIIRRSIDVSLSVDSPPELVLGVPEANDSYFLAPPSGP